MVIETPYSLAIFLLSILSGVFSLFGLPMLIPVLQLMQDSSQPLGATAFFDWLKLCFSFIGIPYNFYMVLVVASFLILAGEIILNLSSLLALYASFDLIRDYSKRMLQSYLKVDWSWLTSTNSGEINYVVMREAELAATCHLYAQRLVICTIQCMAYTIVAVCLSSKVVLVALGIYSVLMILNMRNAHAIRLKTQIINDDFKKTSNLLGGLQQNKKFLKASMLNDSLVQKVIAGFNGIYRNYKTVGLRMQLQQGWNFLVVFVFLVGIIFFSKSLNLNYSTLLVLLLVFNRLAPQFNTLSHSYASLNNYLPMYHSVKNRLGEMKIKSEITGTKDFDGQGNIRFENVLFSYHKDTRIIDGLNLEIPARKTIAIVGGSGAGKTTVLDMVLGLLKPTQGKIYYGDLSHEEVNILSVRKQIAYVSQDPTLLDGTIQDNLTLGNPQATEKEIWNICERVHIDKFIKSLPKGLDTSVGENGIQLSGGQRQRIVLGRSLFLNPKILILDEATNELDAESEAMIQKTIRDLSSELTLVIVAHRLSTVRFADTIYVLANGQVCEQGTYEELMTRQGRFYQLDSLQR